MGKAAMQVIFELDEKVIKVLNELDEQVAAYNKKVAHALANKSATLPFMIDALEEAEQIFNRAKAELLRIQTSSSLGRIVCKGNRLKSN
jgi:hypothetical protein